MNLTNKIKIVNAYKCNQEYIVEQVLLSIFKYLKKQPKQRP